MSDLYFQSEDLVAAGRLEDSERPPQEWQGWRQRPGLREQRPPVGMEPLILPHSPLPNRVAAGGFGFVVIGGGFGQKAVAVPLFLIPGASLPLHPRATFLLRLCPWICNYLDG
nr:uncharacterized protein LOC117859951 [Setaria viridis]